jgi:Nucleotidyl transferase AbiEii toxin, Type IV TA system
MALPKRVLLPQEQALLRETLQMSAISALMNARRWEPGDIVFQGGTSLHLAHGSARFSEDLDFMVRDDLPLHGEGLRTRLQIYPARPVASHAASQLATASRWLTNASVRLGELESKEAPADIAKDLQRWLPSTWPMNAREAARMLIPTVYWLRTGIERLQAFVKTRKRS